MSYRKRGNMYRSFIRVNGKQINIGTAKTIEEAIQKEIDYRKNNGLPEKSVLGRPRKKNNN